MKKLFIVIAVLCACALTSCTDPNKEQCWEITITYANNATATYLFWADGDTSDAYLKKLALSPDVKTASKMSTFVSEGDCGTVLHGVE